MDKTITSANILIDIKIKKPYAQCIRLLVYFLGHFLSDRANEPLIGEMKKIIQILKPVLTASLLLSLTQKK